MEDIELPDTHELQELKEKKFSRRIALVTACYAVALAITSLGGNQAAKEMILAQQQASDQWAFYQSKVLREHLYRLQETQARAILTERGATMNAPAAEMYRSLVSKAVEAANRYEHEKKEIEDKAKELEHERDKFRVKDPYFERAEALLQIAIVMASISILANSLPVFFVSLGAAACGIMLSANGFFMVFKIPFLI